MKTPFLLLSIIGLLATSCAKTSPETEASVELIEGAHFLKNKGLVFPEVTKKTIGFETAEVSEEKLTYTVNIQAQVFRRNGSIALASGTMSSDEAERLKVGQELQLRSSAPEATEVSGKVIEIHKKKGLTGSHDLVIQIADPENQFSVRRIVKGRYEVTTGEAVPTIPHSALLKAVDGDYVYTVNGSYFLRTPVTTGAEAGGLIEIKEGLYSGDVIVKSPVQTLWLTELQSIRAGKSCCIAGH